MSGKSLKTGGEVDSYCTKCKMILNHRIVAMMGATPVRVECLTCDSQHNYRAKMPGAAKTAGATKTAGGRAVKETVAVKAARAEQAERERTQTWEKAIAGKGVSDFRPYRVSEKFAQGDLVRHSKFGDGVILRIVDLAKISILFKDGEKLLAQGLTN
jgi:hypothetical protein